MTLAAIRQFCIILSAAISVLGLFFAAFYKELRFSLYKTAGILAGYLLFILLLSGAASVFLPINPWSSAMLPCLLIPCHMALCVLLSRMRWTVIFYALFMFQNLTDSIILCSVLLQELLRSKGLFFPSLLPFLMLLLLFPCVCRIFFPYLCKAAEYTQMLSSWKALASIPLVFFIIFRCIIFDIASKLPSFYGPVFFRCLFWSLCVYLVHYVVLHALSNLAQNLALRERYKTTRLLADLQTAQMSQLQRALDEAAQARHNVRFQFVTVKGFLEQKKSQTALNYINAYLGSIHSSSRKCYCSNLSANSILDYYLGEAEENSIQVTAHVSLPRILPLPEIDFCTILGNLLSNALEACLRQEGGKPFITVNIRQAGTSMITLSVSNSYSHEIRRQNGLFISSKRDRPGIGTLSVRCLTDRYHGVLNYKYGDGLFTASLLLNPAMDPDTKIHPGCLPPD